MIKSRKKIESFKKLSDFRRSDLIGSQGPSGEVGPQGLTGASGANGRDGLDGKDGVDGNTPDHKWEGTKLAFEKPDGSWGESIDLKGDRGEGGFVGQGLGNASIKYTKISTTPFVINKGRLVTGHNIFGVDAGENATVYLPRDADPTKIIVMNNENPNFTVTVKVNIPYAEDGYVEADYVEVTQ